MFEYLSLTPSFSLAKGKISIKGKKMKSQSVEMEKTEVGTKKQDDPSNRIHV